MKLVFSENFKNEILEYGGQVRLELFKINGLGDYHKFESIWDQENNNLYMTLDLSYLDSVDQEIFEITVYYSDMSGGLIGEAFKLIPSSKMCTFGIDPGEQKRRDLNHITVKFPSLTLAWIDTKMPSDTIQFLETAAIVPGINTFLALEDDEFENSDFVTKDSYKRYLRNLISQCNSNPLYLNRNGEKVYSIATYKHYKSISIQAIGTTGDDNTFYVNSGTSISITGSCVYDLYQVSNSEYTLLEENAVEDLSATMLVEVDAEGNPITSVEEGKYEIEQLSKIIKFLSSSKGSEKLNFACTLSFKSELGNTLGETITLVSNSLSFITYKNWRVEYSSNLTQEDENGNLHSVLLFDTGVGDTGWDYTGGDKKPGLIRLYTESDIPVDNILISSGQSDLDKIFSTYFSTSINKEGYDNLTRLHKYTIQITTRKSSVSSDTWFPIDTAGKSILILNKVSILGADDAEDVYFYCVQRDLPTLTLGQYTTSSGWSTVSKTQFQGTFGFKSITGVYVIGQREGYNFWEATVNSPYLGISTSVQGIEKGNVNPDLSNAFQIYTTSSYLDSTSGVLGSITFKRLNASKGYNESYWKDLMYCGPGTEKTIEFTVAEPVDNNFIISNSTPYFFNDSRLFLYGRGQSDATTQEVMIKTRDDASGSTWSISFDSTTDEIAFKEYFTYQLSSNTGNEVILSVTKREDISLSKNEWAPRKENAGSGRYTPVPVNINNTRTSLSPGEESNSITYTATFYFIVEPDFSDSIKIYDSKTLGEIDSIRFEETDETDNPGTKERAFYVASNIGAITGYNYWMIMSKDLEVNTFYNDFNLGIGGARRLITSDKSTWKDNAEPIIQIRTSAESPNTLDKSFDPLVIRRSTGSYENLLEYYKDWENQLCRTSEITLPMSIAGQPETENITVYVMSEDGFLTPLKDEDTLNLDYIGLYKLYVKSSSMYRVSLEGLPDSDHFYFYDSITDEAKKGILSFDEGSFNTVTGKEICFIFYGNEKDTFKVEEQKLRTYLKFTSLVDNSSVIIYLGRKYFKGNLPIIDTNIIRNYAQGESRTNDIFMSSSKVSAEIKYRSYLETTSNIEGPISVTTTAKFNYDTYGSPGTYRRNGKEIIINNTRGYKEHTSTITLGQYDDSENNTYPLSPIGTVDIGNPERFNGEGFNFTLYKLTPAPTISTNKDIVRYSYAAGKSSDVSVEYNDDSIYEAYYCAPGSSSWLELGEGDSYFQDIIINKAGDKFTVIDDTHLDYTGDVDKNMGSIKFSCFVDKNNFIKDFSGEIRNDYTQEEVNNLVGSSEKIISIWRLCKANSESFLAGDTSLISRIGETRVYQLSKKDDEVVVDAESSKSEQSAMFNTFEYLATGDLTVSWKSRLIRSEYTNNGESINFSGSSLATSVLSKLKSFSNDYLDSDFYLKVGNDKVYITNLQQDKWSKGIYDSARRKLYMGFDNYVTVYVDYNAGVCNLYLSSVNLPIEDGTIFTDPQIPEESTFGSLSYQIYNSPVTSVTSYSYGYRHAISVPINNSTSSISAGSVIIKDGYGNEVVYNIIVNAKDDYIVEGYTSYTMEGNTYIPNTSLSDYGGVAFSASGKLRVPDEYIYVFTDHPYASINISSNGSGIMQGDTSHKNGVYDYYEDRVVSSEKLGNARRGNTNGYLWKVKITSKINYFYFSSYYQSQYQYTDMMGHKPFTRSLYLYLSSSSSTYTFIGRYGSCTFKITGPTESFIFHQYHCDDGCQSYDISYYKAPPPAYYTDFSIINATESSKYTTANSYFRANSKLYSKSTYGTPYYYIENKVWLTYTDTSTPKYFGSTAIDGIDRWNNFGYYCGFYWDAASEGIEKIDWVRENGNWYTKTASTLYLTGNSQLKLIDINTKVDVPSSNTHEERGINKTRSVSKYYGCDESWSNSSSSSGNSIIKFNPEDTSYFPGILFHLTDFTVTGNTYNTTQTVKLYDDIDPDDQITFTFDITLIKHD